VELSGFSGIVPHDNSHVRRADRAFDDIPGECFGRAGKLVQGWTAESLMGGAWTHRRKRQVGWELNAWDGRSGAPSK